MMDLETITVISMACMTVCGFFMLICILWNVLVDHFSEGASSFLVTVFFVGTLLSGFLTIAILVSRLVIGALGYEGGA